MASTRRYQQKLAEGRRAEEREEDLNKHLKWDKMLRENYKSDDRSNMQRRNRERGDIQREMYAETQLAESTFQSQQEAMLRTQDEMLAKEISRRKIEATREAKNVQRICEQSEELRELEEKLKAAYMNKERAAQVQEKHVINNRKKSAEATMDSQIEEDRQRGLMAEAYREHLRRADAQQVRYDLIDQMAEQEERKQSAYEEFLKEKTMVDEIVKQIMEEDQAELEARMAKQRETREFIERFIDDREEWKRKKQEEVMEENRKIQEYAAQVMERERMARLKKKSEADEKDRILGKLTEEINVKRSQADELEQLRVELEVQEVEEKVLQKEKEMMEKRIRDRMEMMMANEYQKEMKALKREEEKEEEEEFRRRMMDKFAEDARIEQMNAQKRRMKQLEHRREIERLLEERRKQYEHEREGQLQEHLEGVRVEEMKRRIIEEERQRLLMEHAANLGLEHLPKGVLARFEDLDFFGKGQ